jgi:heme o synthase
VDHYGSCRGRIVGAGLGGQFGGLDAEIIAGVASVIDYWRLIRPRIVAMVLAAMSVSAWTAAEKTPDWLVLFHALLGTLGVIAGAIAFNQRIESGSDAKMPRTAGRPLPSGSLTPRQVTRFAVLATIFGLVYLAVFGNPLLAGLALLSWIFYVAAYTPMKKRSLWQTPVGAMAGAMPMLLGAAAVESLGSRLAWCLFGIMFFWQFPHSMAIAWLYRREFATAEVRVATVVDATGRTAGVLAVVGAALLLPIGLLPAFLSLARWEYAIIAGVLGLIYLRQSVQFYKWPCDANARRMLGMSLFYLPILLVILLIFRA